MKDNEKKTPADHVTENVGHADIKLSRPTKIDNTELSALRMREPTVADMERMQDASGTEAAKEVGMFANLCNITPDQVRALPLRDYARLQAAFALFTI